MPVAKMWNSLPSDVCPEETDCNIAILILRSSPVMIWPFVNLVNCGPVTPEFNIGKDVHPVVSFFKINVSDKLSRMVGI